MVTLSDRERCRYNRLTGGVRPVDGTGAAVSPKRALCRLWYCLFENFPSNVCMIALIGDDGRQGGVIGLSWVVRCR